MSNLAAVFLVTLAIPSFSYSLSVDSAVMESLSDTEFRAEILQRSGADGVRSLHGKHTVVLRTTKGDITLELRADAAPKTVTNFILLSKAGYYDGMTFHRVIENFMIQGGDPYANNTGGRSVFGRTFNDEINLNSYPSLREKSEVSERFTKKQVLQRRGYRSNSRLKSLPMQRGAIAMANRGPNTNGSQFFIVQGADVSWLEGQYTVFGKVTSGMQVVDAIAKAEKDQADKPLTPISFSVEVED